MRWGVALCSCNEAFSIDPRAIATALGPDARVSLFARLPRDEIHGLVALAGRDRVDRIAVACCGPPELFREAVAAGGGRPDDVVMVDLKTECFLPHGTGAGAHAKAARLLRAAMRGAEAAPPEAEVPLTAGATILIATDSLAGVRLASRVAAFGRPVLLLDDRSPAFDAARPPALPGPVSWGRVSGLDGTLGAFRVTVERTQPLSLDACIRCARCIPVCHTAAISEGLRLRPELCDRCGDCVRVCGAIGAIRIPRQERETLRADQVVIVGRAAGADGPRRTGHHVLRDPDDAAVDALGWHIFSLVGDFQRPDYVAYDPGTCAGGAAGHQSCGVCIPACPYEAIERDPRNRLRITVEARACEGCGACVAVCPTSALTFRDPPPATLYGRLAALLAPLPGADAPPPVVAFHCPVDGRRVLRDRAGLAVDYGTSVLPVPMACLRHVSEANILAAFRLGAAGVALVGCEQCPHGDRSRLTRRLDLVGAILDGLGVGRERLALLTVAGESASSLDALRGFAARLGAVPAPPAEPPALPASNREVVAHAIGDLLSRGRATPARVPVESTELFAVPDVRVADCTLSRACVNVCPTHAFRFDEARATLELRPIACVNCGLCVQACPERAITLRPEVPLDETALGWQVVVRDEPVACLRCHRPFINRRALAAVEARVFAVPAMLDAFAGPRRQLLRMCADCRAVTAMEELDRGWKP